MMVRRPTRSSFVPARWQDAWVRARKDLTFLVDGLRGRGPTLYVDIPRATTVPSTRRLVVEAVREETHDATTLVLAPTDGHPFHYEPGQFTTLTVEIDGQRHRRCYSFSSGPSDGSRLSITCKRVPGGAVSPWLTTELGPGSQLTATAASGRFVVGDLVPEVPLVLIAGGSGVTPIRSILESELVGERRRLVLIDANRSAADIVFHERLDALAAEHGDRLTVVHVLEDPADRPDAIEGRLDEATAGQVLADLADGPAALDSAHYFVCGPTPMMDGVRNALLARSVPADHIHEERFTVGKAPRPLTKTAWPMTVRHAGGTTACTVPPGTTLLEAGIEAGLPMPSSCTMGGCGACRVRLVSGDAVMEEPNCLTANERQDGLVLACVTRPTSPVTISVEQT